VLVASAAAMFGTLSYLARSADAVGMSALPFVAWRGAIGTIVVLGLSQLFALRSSSAAGRASPVWLPTKRGRALLIACVLGAIVNVAMFEGFMRTTIAVVLICFYTYPAIVTLAAVVFYGERVTLVRGAALALSGAGLVILVLSPVLGSGITLDPAGVGLAVTAALCQAAFFLIAGRGFEPLSAARTATYAIFAAGALALFLAVIGGDLAGLAVPLRDSAAWLWIIAGGIIGAAIPTTALLVGIGIVGPSRAAVLMTIEPLVGVTVAALLLGEHPIPLQIVGGAAVLVAAIILQLAPSRVPAEPEFGRLV
jgi:drug/metabolite transporter (DMT)-like permease